VKSFSLPDTNWSFEEAREGQTWYIEIYNNACPIVKAQASNKRLALERAWNMLADYCRQQRRPTKRALDGAVRRAFLDRFATAPQVTQTVEC
jgi:hypothetical protein